MKNEKNDFCQDQEGHKGSGIYLMQAMHLDVFAIHVLLKYQFFFILELI